MRTATGNAIVRASGILVFLACVGTLSVAAHAETGKGVSPLAAPDRAGRRMKTLEQIYQRVSNGVANPADLGDTFQDPASFGTGGTMYNLQTIFDALPVPDGSGALEADVCNSKAFWGVGAEWGQRSGKRSCTAPEFVTWPTTGTAMEDSAKTEAISITGATSYLAKSDTEAVVPNGSITVSDTELAFTPVKAGQTIITVWAKNSAGLTTTNTVTYTVDPNTTEAPTVSGLPSSLSLAEDSPAVTLPFTVADNFTAAASLTVTATPAGGAPYTASAGGSGANRTVTITPTANANGGPVNLTVSVTDGEIVANTTTSIIAVTIAAVNDPPVPSTPLSRTVTTGGGAAVVVTRGSDCIDADGSGTITLGYFQQQTPLRGTLAVNVSGNITYDASSSGSDTFYYSCDDGVVKVYGVVNITVP